MITPFVFLSTMTATAASSSSFGYVSSLWMPNASSTEHRGYHFTLASPAIGGGGGVTVFACGISGELTVVDYSTPEHPVPIANLTGPQLLQSRTMLWYARLAHVCLKLKRGLFLLKKKDSTTLAQLLVCCEHSLPLLASSQTMQHLAAPVCFYKAVYAERVSPF